MERVSGGTRSLASGLEAETPYNAVMTKAKKGSSGLVGCLAGIGAVLMGLWLAFYDIPVWRGRIIFDAYHPDTGRTEAEYVTPIGLAFRAAEFVGCVVLVVRALMSRHRRSRDQ